MAPKKNKPAKDAPAPAVDPAPAPAPAAAAAADNKKQTLDKPADNKPAGKSAAKPAAGTAATTSMKVAKKTAPASEPKNDLKEEDIDRQKLESAMRRRQQIERGDDGAGAASRLPAYAIDADVSRKQREKQRMWIADQEKELDALRDRTKQETEKNSDIALKVVIAVWVLIILGIFFHVFRTIEQGSRPNAPAAVRNPNSADGSWTAGTAVGAHKNRY